MKPAFACFLALALGLEAASAQRIPANPEAAATVVVFNENDADSHSLARYYAEKRAIPKQNVVGLRCSSLEEISREEYDREIAEPLRKIFQSRGWWKRKQGGEGARPIEASSIRYVALVRGIPLKIAPHFGPYEGDQQAGPAQISIHNCAAVDSELAVLGVFSREISGAMNNPYFGSPKRFTEVQIPPLLLVCRLDAPAPEMVRRMIDDSLATEQRGLRGIAYVDARGIKDAGLADGDAWILNTARIARMRGLVTVLDEGEGLFPMPYPMAQAAVYFGWYAEHVSGPFIRQDFKFNRGAVAVHLHSFSGASLRDARRYWCAPLIASGAAATLGNVYEPFLGLTPRLDVFFERLRVGFNFAESAYISQRSLSWMTTFVGDPLYRPFKNFDDRPSSDPSNEWEAYALGARIWFEQGPDAGARTLEASAKKFRSGIIYEGLGLLQIAAKQHEAAVKSFELAAMNPAAPGDAVRATVHALFQLKGMGRTEEAVSLARKRIAQYAREPGAEILRMLEASFAAPAAAPEAP
jgi:uncharacterized protein (TIGR03790 family)